MMVRVVLVVRVGLVMVRVGDGGNRMWWWQWVSGVESG